MSDIVTLKVEAPPEQVVLKVPGEPVATIIRVSEPGGTDTEYVDAGDARTLAEAKDYTDDHVVPVGYIDDGDEQTLLDAKGYADQVYVDLGTEIDNLTPTIRRIDQTSSNNEYRILELKGQVDNLPAADVTKAYVDTGLSNKSDKSHQHTAADVTSGVFPPARLGTGTANAASFLSGDGTFKIPPGVTNAQVESAVNAYLAANPPSGDPWHKVGNGPPGSLAANVGTTYTDLAQTNGARKWFKINSQASGWKVVDGDTGWRRIPTPTAFNQAYGFINFRRINDEVTFLVSDVWPLAAGEIIISPGGAVGMPGFRPTGRVASQVWREGVPIANSLLGWKSAGLFYQSAGANSWTYATLTALTAEAWPTGALIGIPG